MADNPMGGARVLVDTCGNVKAGEDVLVIAEADRLGVAQPVASVASERGADVVLAIMRPRSAHGEEPPAPILAAMQRADVIYSVTKYSLFHTEARRSAVRAGARFLNMVDYDEQMLIQGGLEADFLALQPVAEQLGEILTEGRHLHVTTPAGTDIVLDISGRAAVPQLGTSREAGRTSAPPNIEAAVSPLEGSGDGIVVVDGSIPHPSIGVIEHPIHLTVREGRIVHIAGGRQAEALQNLLSGAGDDSVYVVAEASFGLNPCSRLCGKMLEDEGAYGTFHFGWGDNTSFGGHNRAPMHLDTVCLSPTVTVDGVVVMEDGELAI
jgi:leucyl aminopeptidase (aminopeptidase T)